VDFWSPATDLAFVDQLAQSTLCYRSPACEVTFVAQPQRAALRPAPARDPDRSRAHDESRSREPEFRLADNTVEREHRLRSEPLRQRPVALR
jgi:hypothetical protein